jgi:hypothetical protein
MVMEKVMKSHGEVMENVGGKSVGTLYAVL